MSNESLFVGALSLPTPFFFAQQELFAAVSLVDKAKGRLRVVLLAEEAQRRPGGGLRDCCDHLQRV